MGWFLVGESIDRPVAVSSRALSKWWLDLLRNVLVASVLHALATRSGSTILSVIAYSAWLAVYAYSISYILEWNVLPFANKAPHSKVWFALAAGASSLIVATLLASISIAITLAITELANLQK
jgi:hypothetical protein